MYGTIVETIMQVFTTIFLAENVGGDAPEAETPFGDFDTSHGHFDVAHARLECITVFEARNWFLDDLADDD
jgi:hypothetical protein